MEHMTHTTEDWHDSPLPKGSSWALTVPSGRGVLWRPLRTDMDRNTGRGPPEQNRQTGTMAVQGAQEAMAELGAQETMVELGAQEAMADGLRRLGLSPLGPAPTARTLLTPPQKKFPGEVRGYQEPSGARQTGQYMTWQEKALQGQTNRTGHPTGTRSAPGLAWKLRFPLGMTRSQGPSQGPSATASTSATGRQAAGMASAATTRGAAYPRQVSADKTRFF